MATFNLTSDERLAVLAAAVLDHLDGHAESVIENDPDLAALYNLAGAMEEAARPVKVVGAPAGDQDRNRLRGVEVRDHADRLATDAIMRDDEGRLAAVRERLLASLEETSC